MTRLSTQLNAVPLVSLALVCLVGCGVLAPSPDYVAARNVGNELQRVMRMGFGEGIVIVGQLERPPNADVSARIPLEDDGSYCTALYPKRKLVFFAHGYEPLEIAEYKRFAGRIYDGGVRRFIKAAPENRRHLRAKFATTATEQWDSPITCVLQIVNREYLWEDHGYSSGSSVVVTVETTDAQPGEAVRFKELSRIPYRLVVKAPGFIKREFDIDVNQDGVIDLGEIVLDRAPRFRIAYKARVRHNGGKWVGGDSVEHSVIECDGNTSFQFSDQRDGLGNRLRLRITPQDDGIEASFFFRKENSFYHIGPSDADEIPAWDEIDRAARDGSTRVTLEPGQLYYFTIDNINGTEIELIFRVSDK